jgi:hypothetical protein
MSLDLTKQRLSTSKDRVNRFIDQNIRTWAMETILLPARVDIANSISQRAAQALTLEKTGFMKVDLVWDLRGDDNEPLHFFLEFGTDAHKIRAKGKLFGGADSLHWITTSGRDAFAKEVNHPGSKKHVGLVQGIKNERLPDLKAKIISETQNWLEINKI